MKSVAITATALALSFCSASAYAGGWGSNGSLINVSPSVDTGSINVLSGIANGNVIASGNVVSGVLSGNKTDTANGVLGGSVLGILGANSYKLKK